MERLASDPHERKVRTFFGTPDWRSIEPMKLACESVGIGRLADASVLHWRSGTARIVDFGVVGLHRLQENLRAINVDVSPADLREIDQEASKIAIHGQRYGEASQRMIDR